MLLWSLSLCNDLTVEHLAISADYWLINSTIGNESHSILELLFFFPLSSSFFYLIIRWQNKTDALSRV